MTTTVITSLPELGTIADITYIPVETSGVTQKISGLTIKNYIKSTLAVSTSTSFSGDVTVGGLTTLNSSAFVGGDLTVVGNITANSITVPHATITGGSITNVSGYATTLLVDNLSSGNVQISGNASILTVDNLIIGTSLVPSGNTVVNLGSPSHWFGAIYGVSTAAKYADLAEKYTSDADYEPGTVVVFGDDTEVTISKSLADNRVAGVVTTNPAYLMNAESEGVAVALTGRVPCKVIGKFKRGDMLVTSDIAGVATYSGEPRIGTIIGKALERYDNLTEVGVIEVVVGRL